MGLSCELYPENNNVTNKKYANILRSTRVDTLTSERVNASSQTASVHK